MCAVIGAVINKPTTAHFEMIKRVFLESKIRGLHATGISFLPKWSSGIETIKEPIPADQFIEKFLHNDNLADMVAEDGNLYLIGHCRYSTSDLEFNQPIYNNYLSVVHNGVITQELPENWENKYGYKCEGKNDTELILHSYANGKSPLVEWQDSSLAVCVLSKNRVLTAFRNGKRPLYLTSIANGCIITSTADVIHRAGIVEKPELLPMNTYFSFDDCHTRTGIEKATIEGAVDLQHDTR
jgi:asparagine synthetase B (glutamine-hydrolysing)